MNNPARQLNDVARHDEITLDLISVNMSKALLNKRYYVSMTTSVHSKYTVYLIYPDLVKVLLKHFRVLVKRWLRTAINVQQC